MIAYEDGAAALNWLAAAFGFRERTRLAELDGRISHAEMETGDGVIMLASPTPHYESPRRHREGCDRARRWSAVPWVIDGVLVYVDDVNQHYERAKRSGATILSEPEEDGYGRIDLGQGYGCRIASGARRPDIQGVLYHQGPWDWHGTAHQSLDH